MSGIPLTAINGGMNRLRVKGAARRDTLYQLTNGYVTAGGTIKARGGTLRNVDLSVTTGAGATKGLVAYSGSRHIFSDHVVPVPAGYTLHVLNHPAQQAIYAPPFPAAAGTPFVTTVQSLLHFEDGNGSTTFADAGAAAPVWTSVGGAACDNAHAKFGSTALLCNSTTKYVSTPVVSGGALDFTNNQQDWTVEFWVYPTTNPGGVVYQLLDFSCGSTTLFKAYFNGTSSSIQTSGSNPWNSAGPNATNAAIVAAQWNHVAICRDNNVIRFLVNGVTVGVGANSFASIGPAIPGGSSFYVGGGPTNFGTAQNMWIDDFRITMGTCLYGATSITPPSAALTTTPTIPYTFTSLVHFDDGANSTAFTDSNVNAAPTWTAFGAAKEVMAPLKFGSGSGAFLNNADYIKTSVTAAGNLDMSGQCDWTFECFIYPLDVSSGNTHMWMDTAHRTAATNQDGMFELYSVGGTLSCHKWGAVGTLLTANGALPTAGVWYHVAVVRYGYEIRLFVNGVLVATGFAGVGGSFNELSITTGAPWFVGANGYLGTQSADGYIDELRVIKGLAVYRANFTPPTAPFTAPGVTTIALKEIHFAAPFLGFLYVVAEFVADAASAALGSVFHYWLQTSGTWTANTPYQVGQIVSPTVANGLTFKATRVGTPKPAWAPSTLHAVNDIVEPTVANGYKFKATAVDGTNPITGTTEPTWPTTDGTVVYEESEKTDTGAVTAPATQPSANTPSPGTGGKYTNPYSGFGL